MGGLNVFFAIWGLFALAWSLVPVLRVPQHGELPHFHLALAVMAVAYGICMLLLFGIGVFFLRLNLRPWRIFIGLMIVEVVLALAAGMDWHAVAPALTAADRVLTGPVFLAQFICLYPVWSSILIWRIHRG